MNRVPDSKLTKIPGGTLITETPELGQALDPLTQPGLPWLC